MVSLCVLVNRRLLPGRFGVQVDPIVLPVRLSAWTRFFFSGGGWPHGGAAHARLCAGSNMVRFTPEALLVPDEQWTHQARDLGKTYISLVGASRRDSTSLSFIPRATLKPSPPPPSPTYEHGPLYSTPG